MISLTMDELALVKQILHKNIPQCEVRVFGSRNQGVVKPHSDLDLAIYSKDKLDRKIIYQLQEDFADSNLPFRVDIVDWNRISEEFKQIILKSYQVIQHSQESQHPAGSG